MEDKKVVKAEVVKEVVLTDDEKKIASEIRESLKRTAETIVEIGEKLIKATKDKQRGFKEVFYKEIGMTSRSAQRYMQIANHTKVKNLKKNKNLEGKTMTDLLQIIAPDTSAKEDSIDTQKVASGFYSRFKDKPEKLKEIIEKLQSLLDDNENKETTEK